MTKTDNPCYECDKHSAECHSHCKPYLEWSDGVRELHAQIRKARMADAIATGHGIDTHNRNKKRQHIK